MYDGNRSSTFEEVRKTLARAEAAKQAAEAARDHAVRIRERADEVSKAPRQGKASTRGSGIGAAVTRPPANRQGRQIR